MTARLWTYADAGLHVSMRDWRDYAVAIPAGEGPFLGVVTGRNCPGGPRYSAALRFDFDVSPCESDDVIRVKKRPRSPVLAQLSWRAHCARWPASAMLGLASRY
jgi:hypothetical protein